MARGSRSIDLGPPKKSSVLCGFIRRYRQGGGTLLPAAEDREATVRVVVADDNQGVRELLRLLIDLDGRLRLVGEAADGRETLEIVAVERPDVLLLDLGMPALDGLQVLG